MSVPPSPGPMCLSQRVFLCLEALAVALLRLEAAGGATWSVDSASQKETPAEGRGSKTSLGSVTLFPPREAFFLTYSLSLPNWHCDSCWWTACRLSSAGFLSPAHHPLLSRRDVSPVASGLLNSRRDHVLVQMSSPTPQFSSNIEIFIPRGPVR